MALGLTIADKRDGTGATATVTGADSAAVTVNVMALHLGVMVGAWVSGGTRTGNGTVSLVLSKGIYFAHATGRVAGAAAISQVVTFGVTDGADPLHYRCMVGIRDVLLGLSLAEITSANVIILKKPYRIQNFIGSCGIIISPLPESTAPHDNRRSEWTPAVQVVMFRASNQCLGEDVDGKADLFKQELDWRFRLTMALQETSLPGVPEVARIYAQPGPLLLPEAFAAQYDAGGIVFRCQTYQEQALYP